MRQHRQSYSCEQWILLLLKQFSFSSLKIDNARADVERMVKIPDSFNAHGWANLLLCIKWRNIRNQWKKGPMRPTESNIEIFNQSLYNTDTQTNTRIHHIVYSSERAITIQFRCLLKMQIIWKSKRMRSMIFPIEYYKIESQQTFHLMVCPHFVLANKKR